MNTNQDRKNQENDENNNTEKKKSNFRLIHIFIIILVVAVVSILGAIIINELYKAGGGYQTEWGATDVLMFFGAVLGAIGTVGLGGLTIWQNEKLRGQNERLVESNDDFQVRIEKLTIEANSIAEKANELYLASNESLIKSNELLLKSNEQSIINKIIEYESKRLERISVSSEELQRSCLGIDMGNAVFENKNIRSVAAEQLQKAGYSYINLCRDLRTDKSISKESPVMKTLLDMYTINFNISKKIIDDGRTDLIDQNELDTLKNAIDSFRKEFEDYTRICEYRLKVTIFKELTLKDIRQLYGYNLEEQNGQDEDAE